MKITGKQIAMARILLDLNQKDLAEKLDITRKTIIRIESGQSPGSAKTLETIQTYFENNGVAFTNKGGVEQNDTPLQVLNGHQGFSDFLDDVYATALKFGTKENPAEVYLSNVKHQNWIDWMGEQKWKNHTNRMSDSKHLMDVRILIKEGDQNFPASDYSHYKHLPENLFNEHSFYSYGDKLAFLDFQKNDVQITIMQHEKFALGYRALFKIAWSHFAKNSKQ